MGVPPFLENIVWYVLLPFMHPGDAIEFHFQQERLILFDDVV